MSTPSPDAHALTGAYLLDALSPDELGHFENHLASCPACAADITELGEAVGRLGAARSVPPPPGLKPWVLHLITETRQLPPLLDDYRARHRDPDFPADPWPPQPSDDAWAPKAPDDAWADRTPDDSVRRIAGTASEPQASDDSVRRIDGAAAEPQASGGSGSPRRVGRRTFVVLVAAGVTAVAGAGVVAVDQHRETVAARQGRDELTAILAASDTRTVRGSVSGGGRATVVMSRERDSAVVLLDGLRKLPGRRVYQLWLIDGRHRARSVGVVDDPSSPEGTVVRGLTGAVRFGLTTEPEGGSARPTLPAATMILLA